MALAGLLAPTLGKDRNCWSGRHGCPTPHLWAVWLWCSVKAMLVPVLRPRTTRVCEWLPDTSGVKPSTHRHPAEQTLPWHWCPLPTPFPISLSASSSPASAAINPGLTKGRLASDG